MKCCYSVTYMPDLPHYISNACENNYFHNFWKVDCINLVTIMHKKQKLLYKLLHWMIIYFIF
jgi:hypothetical protein